MSKITSIFTTYDIENVMLKLMRTSLSTVPTLPVWEYFPQCLPTTQCIRYIGTHNDRQITSEYDIIDKVLILNMIILFFKIL